MSITGIQLRSSHYQAMTVTLGATKVAGALDKIGDTVGVYYAGGVSGDKVAFVTQADKILLAKKDGAGEAIAQGAKVYYEAASGKVTGVVGTNVLCGRALEAVLTSDTTVLVAFNGLAAA